MLNFIISLILGAGLDSLYYFMFITSIKNIKKKKLLLYIMIFIGYVIFYMIFQYNLYLYIMFYIYFYIIIKVFYKSHINDIFVILFLDIYFILNTITCYYLIPNYIIAILLNKLLLFLPLLFKNKLQKLYKLYVSMWNRNDKKKYPIKSLTLRNISLLMLNILIVLTNLVLNILVK